MRISSLPKTKILSVDDDPDLLFATRVVMQSFDYTVISALNGEDIWSILDKEAPDVILLDIQMPGITGDTICSTLKNAEATKNIQVIMLSGNENIAQVAKNCGANAFIKKPFNGSEIHACIRKLKRQYRA